MQPVVVRRDLLDVDGAADLQRLAVVGREVVRVFLGEDLVVGLAFDVLPLEVEEPFVEPVDHEVAALGP